MNCDVCTSLIDDYVDGAIAAEDRIRVDAHLATCPACHAMAEDISHIRLAALGLEKQTPPARAWARLSAALEEERRRPRWWSLASLGWQPIAVAAALLVIVGGTSAVLWRQMSVAPARGTTATAPAADPELVQSVETELRLAEEHYQKAIAGLEQITRTESAALDPQVASVLQKNLAVIDQAIGESRAALHTQPASDVAQESLFEALRNKVSLLQDTVVLINEMRKGNQEGAARIVSGLNQ